MVKVRKIRIISTIKEHNGSLDIVQAKDVSRAAYPPWFRKILIANGYRIGPWFDHGGKIRGTDIVISEPYDLGLESLIHLQNFCATHKLDCCISATSEWYPTRTLRIAMCPEGYRIPADVGQV